MLARTNCQSSKSRLHPGNFRSLKSAAGWLQSGQGESVVALRNHHHQEGSQASGTERGLSAQDVFQHGGQVVLLEFVMESAEDRGPAEHGRPVVEVESADFFEAHAKGQTSTDDRPRAGPGDRVKIVGQRGVRPNQFLRTISSTAARISSLSTPRMPPPSSASNFFCGAG